MINVCVKRLTGINYGYFVSHHKLEDITSSLKVIIAKERAAAKSSCRLVYVDDENEDILIDDEDSIAEAAKIAQVVGVLKVFVKSGENPKKVTEDKNSRAKSASKSPEKPTIKHTIAKEAIEIEPIKNLINFENQQCSNCSLSIVPPSVDGSIINICISSPCKGRVFCDLCTPKHDSYHVMMRMPMVLCEKRKPLAELAGAVIRSAKKRDSRRGLIVLSKKFKLAGNVLNFEWEVMNNGRSLGKNCKVICDYASLPPVEEIVKLPGLKSGQKAIISYPLKFDTKEFFEKTGEDNNIMNINVTLSIQTSDGNCIQMLENCAPILVLGNPETKPEPEIFEKTAEKEPEKMENPLASIDTTTLTVKDEISLVSYEGSDVEENNLDEEFVDFFASAVADHKNVRRDSCMSSTKDDNDSYVIDSSFNNDDASDTDSDIEFLATPPNNDTLQSVKENVCLSPEKTNPAATIEEKQENCDKIQENVENPLMPNVPVGNLVEINERATTEPEIFETPAQCVTKNETEVIKLEFDGAENIFEEKVEEKPTSSKRQHYRDHFSSSSTDNLTDFLSKMLRSTSHAFENVSVASSQAFAVVNDALDQLQTVSSVGGRSNQQKQPEPSLPRPQIRYHKKSPTSMKMQKLKKEQETERPIAWVPKSTQTNLQEENGCKSVTVENMETGGKPNKKELHPTLSKNGSDLEDFLHKARILTELGFMDGAKNARLLMKHNGDLNTVLDFLLNQGYSAVD